MYERKKKSNALKVEFDDQIRESVLDVFACLIPEPSVVDKFAHEAAFRYFNELQKILALDETIGDVWVIYYYLNKLSVIKTFDNSFKFIMDKASFEKGLENNITELVVNNKDAFTDYLADCGVDNKLDIQKTLEDASDFIFSTTLETFEEIQEKEVDVNDCLKYLDILKDVLLTHLSKQSLSIGANIVSGSGAYVGGRYYKGAKDYIEFTSTINSLVSARFSDYLKARRTTISLTDLATLKQFKSDDTTKIVELFQMGFEPLDEMFNISTGDLITLVGDEGVGKTNTAVHTVMQCLMAGHDVLMMTGESSLTKITNMCISNYIYRMTGYQFTWKEIMNYTEENEDDQRLIELWQADFVTNPNLGKLHLIQSLEYETFDTKIMEYIVNYPNLKLVVVDHTDRLNSTGELTEDGYLKDKKMKVDYLYKKEIELKQNFNISFMNLAHSNTETQKAGVKGKDSGVRIGATSSATTKDADFVFYLSKDPNITDDFVKWSCKKVRDYRDSIKPFILKKHFEVSELVYDVEYQLAVIEDEELDIDDMY